MDGWMGGTLVHNFLNRREEDYGEKEWEQSEKDTNCFI